MSQMKRRRGIVTCLSLLSVANSCQSAAAAGPATHGGHPPLQVQQRPAAAWFAPRNGRPSGGERALKNNPWQSQRRRSALTNAWGHDDALSSPLLILSSQPRLLIRLPPRGGAAGAEDEDGDAARGRADSSKDGGGSSDDDDDDKDPPLLSAATVLETTTTTVIETRDEDDNEDQDLATSVSRPSSAAPFTDETTMKKSAILSSEASGVTPEGSTDATASSADVDAPDAEGTAPADADDGESVGEGYDPEESSRLRAQGKELHDAGQYAEAAKLFRQASARLVGGRGGADGAGDEAYGAGVDEEYATCRLHEALCRLKAGGMDQASLAVAACASVLERRDGLPNVLVARAYHRRAKAHVALDQLDDALRDARSAAFLGDRKAVALYGTLLREHPGEPGAMDGGPPWAGSSPTSDSSSSLLDLLMSAGGNGNQATPAASPMDALSQGGFPLFPSLSGMGGDSGGSLASSVLSSLSKKIRDESTQASICNFLQQASPSQLQSFAGMAGFPLAQKQADQLARFCHGITPSTLQGWIRLSQRVSYVVRIVQKLLKVLSKYRAIILLLCLLAWAKSALLRPLPVSKAARKAALRAAAAAAAASATPGIPAA